uniref:Helicase ATP-binding domain-containing protein n=1 Tax=Ditylenchus dipsaci TaxID=166011 RepID=A0A915CXT9_9BILA
MKLNIDGLAALDAPGHCLLEMPSGTGKTVSLLSLVVAYMRKYPDRLHKLIYCSRTIPEIEKCVEELKNLYQYYLTTTGTQLNFLALALSARKNLCINDSVASLRVGTAVDGACQRLTQSFVRAKRRLDPSIPSCQYYEKFDEQKDVGLGKGVYNLNDLKEWVIAPEYIIVYSYHYLLDPKIAELISKDMNPRSCVVFDEGQEKFARQDFSRKFLNTNIDNVCIESMSVHLNRRSMDKCAKDIEDLDKLIKNIKDTDSNRLQLEYEKMLENLKKVETERANDRAWANPVLPNAILEESVREPFAMLSTL